MRAKLKHLTYVAKSKNIEMSTHPIVNILTIMLHFLFGLTALKQLAE
jgi:hypothetical protein